MKIIAASSKYSTKSLSKIPNYMSEYTYGIYSSVGIKLLLGNRHFSAGIFTSLNVFSTVKHCDSYAFSTLYTMYPLKSSCLVYFVVDNRGKAYWSDVSSRASSTHSIAEHRLIEIVGNRVHRQCVGFPDCTLLRTSLNIVPTMRYIDDLLLSPST